MPPRLPLPSAPRLVVCAAPDLLDAVLREMTAAGWNVQASLEVGPTPWVRAVSGLVCSAHVGTSGAISQIAELLARGISVAVEVSDRRLASDLYDQCSRLATAEWHDSDHPPLCVGLDEVQIGLLVELGRGADTAAAARTHHVSERTAARRLAAARRQLGCRTTAEAATKVGTHIGRLRPPG